MARHPCRRLSRHRSQFVARHPCHRLSLIVAYSLLSGMSIFCLPIFSTAVAPIGIRLPVRIRLPISTTLAAPRGRAPRLLWLIASLLEVVSRFKPLFKPAILLWAFCLLVAGMIPDQDLNCGILQVLPGAVCNTRLCFALLCNAMLCFAQMCMQTCAHLCTYLCGHV